ncbi:MAG: SDR family oxidoreductase [Alphaproteobacteria bacterium]|jgi:3-oxoacyl-[acyl-carrier protein] reductase|nr:SDR family oxidoreductase [Alphaproteobacteria bacterium]HJM61037.1 SDR family oxidoreductase [Alphaproteobacteria bacterium]
MKLFDRIALVTGASRGIGRAIALAYAAEGAHLVIAARSGDALATLAHNIESEGREALAVVTDLADEAAIAALAEATLERFGRLDVLVNNAAIIHSPTLLIDFDPALWRAVVDVNLIAPALLTRAVLPAMIKQGEGRIINISSIGGRKGSHRRSAYRATKAGLINLTESVAAEVHEHGIAVTCICPGGVDTEGMREAYDSRGRADNPDLMDPAEIAEVAVFLASDAASAVTGTAVDAYGATNPLFRRRRTAL